jgi:hypothetical protein
MVSVHSVGIAGSAIAASTITARAVSGDQRVPQHPGLFGVASGGFGGPSFGMISGRLGCHCGSLQVRVSHRRLRGAIRPDQFRPNAVPVVGA